jgi:hypothetical protein
VSQIKPEFSMTQHIMTPISPGELIDKITILRIKMANITDPVKLKNVETEHAVLAAVLKSDVPASAELTALDDQLQAINQELWNIEDDIRDCERDRDFGDKFIQLARAVYVTNDKRGELKKQINTLLGSTLVEEKSYAAY